MHDKNPNVEALNMIYQTAKMAIDSIDCVIPKIKNTNLKRDLASQLLSYHHIMKNSSSQLYNSNHYPQEINLLTKIPAAASIYLKSAVDSSESHIAEIMIENSTAGMIELQRNSNHHRNLTREVSEIRDEAINLEQNNINQLRNYL